MRLEVYGWVPATHGGIKGVNLKDFTVPALCHDSRLMRTEMLPLVLKKTKFHANIDSNLVDRYCKRNQFRLTSTYLTSHGRCGLLRLKRKKTELFKSLGNHSLFMDVTLNIFSTDHGYVHRKITKADEIVTSLHLRVDKGKLSIELTTREYHPDSTTRFTRGFNGRFERIDVDATVAAMREVAVKIGERDRFEGLVLDDLIQIVKPARHEVRPKK